MTQPAPSCDTAVPVDGGTATAQHAFAMAAVTKRFGDADVLCGVDLVVRRGEMFALVGINGAGKTTCIKSALDFAAIDSGTIRIHGVDHREARARADLYFLPERFIPPYFLSGRDFLRHAHRLHGSPYDADRAGAVIDALELDARALGRLARTYSKGMAQKLGLAAAFITGKSLLILDEPMSGLDPKARILVKRRLVDERDKRRTVFFTTHMLADAAALCDRMGILHAGRLVFVGTPAECCERFGGADLEAAFLSCLGTL